MQSNILSFTHQALEINRLLFHRRSPLPLKTNSLWRIETGAVRTLSWLEDGTAITLGLWGPGDVVGQALSRVDPYQIECLTEVEVIPVSVHDLHLVTGALLAHVQQSEEFTVIRSCRRTEEMLLKSLVWLAKKFGRETDKGPLIDLRLTHQDLAELLGTTRVTITRLLNQFEQQGLIQRLPQHLTVLVSKEFWHYQI